MSLTVSQTVICESNCLNLLKEADLLIEAVDGAETKKMIIANGTTYNWYQEMSIFDLLQAMGYKLRNPSVLVMINDTIIRKNNWNSFTIPENAQITTLNLLRGG